MSAGNSKTEDKDGKPRKGYKRDDVVRWAVGILESQKDYRNMKLLGRGTFGDVRLMYDPERESAIAVKIVTSENISESELVLWPKLHHPNIVPLLELLTLSVLDVAIFIMPVQNTTLNDVLHEKHFIKHYNALGRVTKWLYQILCGLEYLHSKELCHLDIKVDNILISNASVAMLCDFTFLNVTSRPLKRYDLGLPYIYRPPEASDSMGRDILVDGKSYDMWGYGVMILEIFTGFQLANNLQQCRCWIKDVYPDMFNILQADNFFILMYKTFIGVRLKKFYSDQALNFVYGFLMVDCQKRISPLEATQHPFLQKGTITGPPPDPIWIHKVPIDDVSCETYKEMCLRYCTIKDKNSYPEESLSDSEIEEDMEFEDSDQFSYQNSNATDDQSEFSNDDNLLKIQDLSDDNSVIGEPNRIDFQEDVETGEMIIDVTSEGDLHSRRTQSSSPKDNRSSKKFKSYKNSLERFRNRKKECEQVWTVESDKANCKGSIENETSHESVEEQATSSLPSVEMKNHSEEAIFRFNEEVNNQYITHLTDEKQTSESLVLKMEYPPESSLAESNLKESQIELLNKDSGGATAMDVWYTFPPAEKPSEFDEASKAVRNGVIEVTCCPSNELCGLPVKDSKWATGDSIKELLMDPPEKALLEGKKEMPNKLDSNIDCVLKDPTTVTHQMKTLRQRLGELDQMFDDMQKVMVCENCSALNSEEADLDLVQEAQPTISDIAASGESCLQGVCQNSLGELRHKAHVDTLGTAPFDSQAASAVVFEGDLNPAIENPVLHNIDFVALNEDKRKIIDIGISRKFGRRRKLMQWIRGRYLELERVVKRCPYNIMKNEL